MYTQAATLAQHVAHLLVVWDVIAMNLGPITHHNYDVNNGFYCCYVVCETYIVRVGEMPWPWTGLLRHRSCYQRVGCLLDVTLPNIHQ